MDTTLTHSEDPATGTTLPIRVTAFLDTKARLSQFLDAAQQASLAAVDRCAIAPADLRRSARPDTCPGGVIPHDVPLGAEGSYNLALLPRPRVYVEPPATHNSEALEALTDGLDGACNSWTFGHSDAALTVDLGRAFNVRHVAIAAGGQSSITGVTVTAGFRPDDWHRVLFGSECRMERHQNVHVSVHARAMDSDRVSPLALPSCT